MVSGQCVPRALGQELSTMAMTSPIVALCKLYSPQDAQIDLFQSQLDSCSSQTNRRAVYVVRSDIFIWES